LKLTSSILQLPPIPSTSTNHASTGLKHAATEKAAFLQPETEKKLLMNSFIKANKY
jgi:hypothetical protein